MTTQEILQKYFTAIHAGGWEDYITDDFTLIINNLDNVMHGKQAYLNGAGQFYRGTTAVEIKEQFIDGNKATVLARYTLSLPNGTIGYCDVAEFLSFGNDKLTAATIIFDSAPFTDFT